MKEKLMNIKDKVVAYTKENRVVPAVAIFIVVSLILILIAIFALQEFVVSVCVLIIIEAAMAALLHQEELWKHGVLLGLQLVAGFIFNRVSLIGICIIAYEAATFALQYMGKKNE